MSIKKHSYELSVWKETLAEGGQRKEEKKLAIIGSDDMDYLGKATNLQLVRKINGTNTLTFELPDKFFDSKVGDFVRNEFVDLLFNECKLKFFYKKKWYEFYIKNVSDSKKFKSYMKKYTCSDVFIDELSRNGYGITFDEELYNNVEEIGVFSKEILFNSTWEYDSSLNWGDFTEFIEEKAFKLPLSLFPNGLTAHHLNYETSCDKEIKNIFTGESRQVEMGDDFAHKLNLYWDSYDGTNALLEDTETITGNGYIYIPYSQLDFCYITTDLTGGGIVATEEPGQYGNLGYAIAPTSIDPNHLIEFLYIPDGEEVEVDEAGLLLNKNYTYVMTVREWNKYIKSSYFYKFEDYYEKIDGNYCKIKKLEEVSEPVSPSTCAYGNYAAYYDGYLEQIGDLYVEKVKKIAISDRTEINVSDEIDQFVSVYNNKAETYKELFTNEDWGDDYSGYRVCSKISTKQIIPQLARNLIQNGSEIKSTTGWEVMKTVQGVLGHSSGQLEFGYDSLHQMIDVNGNQVDIGGVAQSYLIFTPAQVVNSSDSIDNLENTIVNFGVIGQQKKIEKGQIYALGIHVEVRTDENNQWTLSDLLNSFTIKIGEGALVADGEYVFKNNINIPLSIFSGAGHIETYILFKSTITFENPYVAIYSSAGYNLIKLTLFEAYTKGRDQFKEDSIVFKYSGRSVPDSWVKTPNSETSPKYYYAVMGNKQHLGRIILMEDDVMAGDTYEQHQYFIQKLQLKSTQQSFDTFAQKEYLSEDGYEDKLPLDSSKYNQDDYEIITNYINMNNCEYYRKEQGQPLSAPDCTHLESEDGVCLYQKYGYCPYRFTTEKHCRKIRTLKGEKSNRFNLSQEISKVFEAYPVYWSSHDHHGRVLTQTEAYEAGLRNEITSGRENWMDKRLFYIKEKGKENIHGFRYEENLNDISRSITSDQITTKLYVLDTDSEVARTGLCSIKNATDNPSKDSYVFDFRYYTQQGILDEDSLNRDLYGIDDSDLGFLKTMGYYNGEYDKLSDKIINLTTESFTELQANLEVNLTGIETAQKELKKLEQRMQRYTTANNLGGDYLKNKTFISCQNEYAEAHANYIALITQTFYTDGICGLPNQNTPPKDFLNNLSIQEVRDTYLANHNYFYGILGQFNQEYNQVSDWKKQQSLYLRKINQLAAEFYQKYEPYIKEGTWSDSNYVDDNAYYHDALKVAKESSIPKVQYSISVIDIEPLNEDEDYEFDNADRTYVEDIGMFGINEKTGLPNRLKVIVSSITENPDQPSNNKIEVQDFTTQFEDLFQQVTASVQQLTFNENIYMRSSNFTAQQTVKTESLQGTLDNNNITLVNTSESNVKIDWTGQQGSDINNHNNKYKLDGQGLFFSNDGGQSWQVGVGPDGINADYIKAGLIDVNKIRIVDGNYIYFTWDSNGISAYRDPSNSLTKPFSDFAQFNRYGLSLVEDGKIKLRAGYAFSGTDDNAGGEIDKENEISDSTRIGFYLYNSAGDVIFSTESSSVEGQEAVETARLNLVGEILASNDKNINAVNGYQYSGYVYTHASTANTMILDDLSSLMKMPEYTLDDSGIATFTQNDMSKLDDYAICLFLNLDENMEEVIIRATVSDTTYEYKDFSITPISGSKWIRLSSSQYCLADFVNIRYTKNSVSAEGTYAKIQGHDSEDEKIELYYVINQTQLQEGGQVELYNYISSAPTYYGEGALSKTIGVVGIIQNQPIPNLNYLAYPIQEFSGYKISTRYYENQEKVSSDIGIKEHSALYINNRSDLNESVVQGNSRLFACCKDSLSANQVSNIFSILKDGTVHMGGLITNATSAISLPDHIDISDENIIIDEAGNLKMSFDKIVDFNGQSMTTYISNNINSSLNDALDPVWNSMDNIGQTLQDHYHSINTEETDIEWERPDIINLQTEEGLLEGIDSVIPMITIEYNGNTYHTSLYDLFNAFKYFSTIKYEKATSTTTPE